MFPNMIFNSSKYFRLILLMFSALNVIVRGVENNSKTQTKCLFSRRANMSTVINLSTTKNKELVSTKGPLITIADLYLRTCALTIFYETKTSEMAFTLLRNLAHRGVKMIFLAPEVLLQEAIWARSFCDGYIFLLAGGEKLVHHASIDHFNAVPYHPGHHPPPLWNYKAYYVILLLDPAALQPVELTSLYNFRKTENLAILQESGERLLVWTHTLFPKTFSLSYLDSWSHGKFWRNKSLFPKKFDNFQGSSVRVATFELPPMVVFVRDENGTIVDRLGVDMGVIKALSTVKNFTVDFVEVSGTERWGKQFPNGSWDGMMKEVYTEISDIGICNAFMDYHRFGNIDYSYPYNFMPACFIAPSPKPLPNWQSPALPFTWDTWLSIGISFLIGGALFYIILTLSASAESEEFKSISYSYLYILGALTMRCGNIVPSHMPGRLYSGFVWIFCLIISTAYSANLVAFLSVRQMAAPIDTLEELVSSGLRIGGQTIHKKLFRLSKDKAILALVPLIETDVNFHSIFNRVEDGEFAFFQNREFLELNMNARFTIRGQSTIRIVKECVLPYNVAITLPRHSPLTESLTKDLMRIFESGLMQKWKNEVVQYFYTKYLDERSKIVVESSGIKPLNLDHVRGIFYTLSFGCLMATIILGIETIFHPTIKKTKH